MTARKIRKSKALTKVEEIASGAAAQTLISGGAGLLGILVPWAGVTAATVNTLAMAIIGRQAQQATTKLLEGLRARIEALEVDRKLDAPRLDQVEWDLATHRAIFANAQDPSRTRLYADLLAGALSIDAPDELDLDALLTSVRDLPLGAIQIARGMYEYYKQHPGEHKQIPPNVGDQDRQLYLNRLEATGLVERFFASRPIGSPGFTGEYIVTPSLIRLVQTLEAAPLDPNL